MTAATAAPPVKWAAQLDHVRDVSLLGTADLAFWRAFLAKEGLTPADHGGRARLLLLGADAKYLGLRFREVSVSVFVNEREPAAGGPGAFLVHAFNSSRLFSFLERACFSTPYYHAAIEVRSADPAAIRVRLGGQVVLAAEMAGGSPPARRGEDGWGGAVFLPGGRKFFVARVAGRTDAYPFAPADRLTLAPAASHPVLGWLAESGFAGDEWAVRADARHDKSKTYRRTQAG